jgi:hypothetical protein
MFIVAEYQLIVIHNEQKETYLLIYFTALRENVQLFSTLKIFKSAN